MIISLILLCVFILLLHHYTVQYGRYGRLINCVPGKPGLPILGNLLQLGSCSLEDLWILLHKISNDYYPITKLWIFTVAHVLIRHPDDIQKVLSSNTQHLEKNYLYTFLQHALGIGLVTIKGAKWRIRRKMLTQSFHFNMLKQYVDILIEESNRLTSSAKNSEGLIIPDLVSFIGQHTLNAICETVMGISLPNIGDFQQQHHHLFNETLDNIMYRMVRPWFYSESIFALSPVGRKDAKNLKIFHNFIEKIIAERKLYHERTGWKHLNRFENDTGTKTDDDKATGIQKRRFALMDVLIAASRDNQMSDSDIRAEVNTFVAAGYDTTIMAISFAILLLAEHKNVQDRVREEINAVMQKNGGKLTMTALNNMPYLERCLKETLRLYPSVALIGRVLSKDIKLQSYVIPSGTNVFINIHDLHRDPNFWPNPNVFDPDRFLPEQNSNRHPFSYIPFSKGPRNCIGERFALLEMKVFIASLLHSFYFESVDYLKDIRFKLNFVNRVTQSIRVQFVPIKRIQPFDAKSS